MTQGLKDWQDGLKGDTILCSQQTLANKRKLGLEDHLLLLLLRNLAKTGFMTEKSSQLRHKIFRLTQRMLRLRSKNDTDTVHTQFKKDFGSEPSLS